MKRITLFSVLTTMLLLLSGCGSVPVTGRKQMLLVSDQEVLTLSLQQYDEFIKAAPVASNTASATLVQKVGRNIANAVEAYLTANGMGDQLSAYAWEFNLVKSNEVNAFCMPGGKIVIYEGILPITKDETGLAVVMGHEVAHAVAKHSNERMSQQMLAEYGSSALGNALSGSSSKVQSIAASAFGLGAQYGLLLPYSRKQELEADELGLIFMAMAGYNPNQAASFWMRMSEASGGGVPEFTSTHPSDDTRIKKIQDALPKAMQYYQKGGTSTVPKTGSSIKSNTKTSNEWKF